MIEISNLSLSLGAAPILRGIELKLKPGGVTALIGPNGAGKSTLLHCVAGLNTPAAGKVSGKVSGTVRIDGLDPFTAPGTERARLVALLQQSPSVVSRLRVRELVAFGRWPHHRGHPTPRDHHLTGQALDSFALNDLADRPLDSLSGGQRQRAFIAMTYAQDTPWMLLDGPLNALDPRHARDLMARLRDLARQDGRSILVVLHDINAAAAWTDRIIAMKAGQVLAHDNTNALLTPQTLQDLFDTPFDVLPHAGRKVVIAR